MQAVRDILAAKGNAVFSVRPEASLIDALELMAEKNLGAVLVVGEEGELRGIFSERDFVRKFIIKGRTAEGTKVKEIMTAKVISVGPDTSISECMSLMTENRIRHLPVLASGKLAGVVSIGDVVNGLLKAKEKVISDQASELNLLGRDTSGVV